MPTRRPITSVLRSIIAFLADVVVLTLKSVMHMIEAIARSSNR